MNNKSFILAVLALALIAVFSLSGYLPSRSASFAEARMEDFPKTIGAWQGIDIELNERDYAILETRNLIMRQYKNTSGGEVYLYIIYSSDNRSAIHPPEICYSGGGSTIVEKSVLSLAGSITANKFTIENKDSRQLVAYWFRAGGFNTFSYLRQQFKMALERTLRRKTSGAMIRISTLIKDDDQDAAFGMIKSFCAQIEPLLSKYVP